MGPPSKSPPPGGLPCCRVAAVELQGDQPGPGRRRRHLGAVRGRGSIFTGKLSRLVTLEQISFCRKIPPGGGGPWVHQATYSSWDEVLYIPPRSSLPAEFSGGSHEGTRGSFVEVQQVTCERCHLYRWNRRGMPPRVRP